jgi:DNA-directed RNA polymerase subunit F
MTIFKERLDEEYVTISEVKEILAEVEAERAADPDREMRYELARAIEHVNTFAVLEAEDARNLVEELLELDQVDDVAALKVADLLPRDRDELRSVFAHGRYSLDGDELDEILDVVAKYA